MFRGNFSPKRAKAVAQGRVIFSIMNGNEVVYTSKNFMVAVSMADQLQKANPGINYTMTCTEVKK